jgi:DNA-binding winged helix-turn-helix (wHTH) protein/Tol biopolymer transport system component
MIRGRLYKFGVFTLNAGTMTLRKGEQVISLPPKVFDTLLALVERQGEVISKDQLMKTLWPDSFVEESNLAQNVFLLRKTLGRASGDEDYIQTVPKRGYRISVPVEEAESCKVDTLPVEAPSAKNRSRSWMAPGAGLGVGIILIVLLLPSRPLPSAGNFRQLTQGGAYGNGANTGGPKPAIATDGSRVYFTEGVGGSMRVSQVSAAGGPSTSISLPFSSAQVLDFSPVRSELLVAEMGDRSAETPLWVVPVPAGNVRRLGRLTARDAAWSQDGHRIAFVRGTELFLSDEYGGEQRKLTDLPGLGWRPRWSPDNAWLRLTIFDPKPTTHSIWEVSVDTGRIRPLLPNWSTPPEECCGEWSADGKQYFFQATRAGKTEIWALPSNPGILGFLLPSRRAPVQITNGQIDSMVPCPSPDSKKLFVVGERKRGELERYDNVAHEFVPFLGGIPADFIDFSRDGQWITYALLPEGTLWRSRVDGTERLQLTFPPDEVRVPHWSPDGREVVFHTMGGGHNQQIRLISRDGGLSQVVPGSTGGEMHPMWSSDGEKLIYSDYPFFGARPDQVAIHTLDLKSREVKTLPGSNGLFSPTWSPDGRKATGQALDGRHIRIFDFAKQSWSDPVEGWGIPNWSRNSRYIYFLRYVLKPAIVRLCIQDGKIEEVAGLTGIHPAGGLAGLQFALAPDDSPVLLRDTGTEEIYSVSLQK